MRAPNGRFGRRALPLRRVPAQTGKSAVSRRSNRLVRRSEIGAKAVVHVAIGSFRVCPFPAIRAGNARRRGVGGLPPIVWRTVRSRQKGSSKEPRAGGSPPTAGARRMPLVLTPLGSDQTSLHASPDRRHLFASAGALDPSRVGSATGRAYRSWRRRPPSSCPPRLASPSSRRLFSPL